MMLVVNNDGAYIRETNYWETDYARRGFLYLSINAGAFRLLVPPGMREVAWEARKAEYAVITRGPWVGRNDSFEILFEDHSDNPYSIHVVREQVDRLPLTEDEGRTDLQLLVYTRRGLEAELPARYRTAPQLPYLQPWDK